jgi:hypothetical protein
MPASYNRQTVTAYAPTSSPEASRAPGHRRLQFEPSDGRSARRPAGECPNATVSSRDEPFATNVVG